MIGNNDWLDYMEYRDYIAHSMGMWDKSKVKYKDKIPVGGGKFRYIYDEPNRNRNANRRSVPTYFDKNQRDAERRNAERSSYSRRADTDRRVEARNRVRGIENSRRSMENNALTNRQNTNFNVYQRQQRAGYDAQRRAAEQQGMQNRAANNQQIEANKLARGYANQQRAAEQQMAQNRMNSDARMAQRQQTARADAERRDMEQRTAQGRAQNEQDVANKPKNLFDHMGRALGNAANAVGSALNSAGDWVGDRAREVGEAASGAWNNVTGGDGRLDLEDVARAASPITDVARSAGNWIGDTARNVGDWVDQNITGNTARDNASKAYEDERHYKQLADDAHNSAQNHFTDYQQTGNPDSRESAGIMADWAINDRLNAKDAGQRGDYYQQQADRSLFGRVGNAANAAGQWMGDRAADLRDNLISPGELVGDAPGIDAINAVGRAAGEAGRWLGDRASEAVGAAKNLFDQAGNAVGGVGDFIADRTGLTARNELDAARSQEAQTRLQRDSARSAYQDRLNNPVELNTVPIENLRYKELERLRQAEAAGDTEGARRSRQVIGVYDSALANPETYAQYLQARNDPVTGYQARYTDAAQAHGAAQRDLREAQNAYNNSPLGRAESFARDVGEAASNALGNASSAARNLIETAGGNIAQALNWAQQRLRYAQNTGNPEMIQDAQEVIRTLESPAFNFRDRMN